MEYSVGSSTVAGANRTVRRFLFVRIAVLAIGLLSVGFVPLSHLFKHLLSGPSRFSAQTARELLADDIQAFPLLASTDRFLMPFAAELWDEIREDRPPNKAWVFPALVAFDPDAGPRYANALACFLERQGDAGVVWGLERALFRERRDAQAVVSIGLGVWNELIADLSIDSIAYEFRDGMYVRGRVEGLHLASLETGAKTPLLVGGQAAPGVTCP